MGLRYIVCYLWPVELFNIFPHYLINAMILDKRVVEHKLCVLNFSTILSETFLILRAAERDMIKMFIHLHEK